jgi:hypothetical protein
MLSLHLHIMLKLMSLFISFLHIVSIDELQVHIDITKASCKCSNSDILCWVTSSIKLDMSATDNKCQYAADVEEVAWPWHC